MWGPERLANALGLIIAAGPLHIYPESRTTSSTLFSHLMSITYIWQTPNSSL